MKGMLRTRTDVHSHAQADEQAKNSETLAHRALGGVMIFAQLLLWVTFYGYERAQQAVWQSMAALLPPALILCAVWAGARHEGRATLLLLPCLLMDGCFSLLALSGLIGQLIPHYPPWVGVLVPCGFVWLTVLWAGLRGVSRGAWLLRGLVAVLFIFGTVFLRASNRGDRLFPILGQGIPVTLGAALHGAGSLWGVALLCTLPRDGRGAARHALLPWALGVVWALWFGFIRPWAAGDSMAVGERLMGLARHAASVTLYEMAGLLWMVLLPLSLTGSAVCAQVITRRAFPGCPRFAPPLVLLTACAIPALIVPGQTLAALETLLPYRWALSLLCGALMRGGRA